MPKTILVADDSVTIRKVVELTFHETEIRVESAGNGREALERIAALQPDLVLADVIMPEPSGYEICRTIKSSDHPVPVLLLTGAFEPFDVERARECGADGHVVKPFESRALLGRVEQLLFRPVLRDAPVATPAEEVESLLDDLARAGVSEEPLPAALEIGDAPQEALDWLLGREELTPSRAAADPPTSERNPESPGETARREAPAVEAPGQAPAGLAGRSRLSPEDLDAVARAVVERLSDKVLREIAWEVVPDLAESIIRERIRHLEQTDQDKI